MTIWVDAPWLRQILPQRPPGAHKGSFGTLALVAGSLCYRGAALLAADAALRGGVGVARLCAVEAVCAAAAARLPACTLLPLPEAEGGIAAEAAAEILARRHSALLAGCGLGNTAHSARLVLALLRGAAAPLLLDADALNALAGCLCAGRDEAMAANLSEALDACGQPVVLTPHFGEMARLCGLTPEEVSRRQEAVAAEYAKAHNCVVALKGPATVVADPGGDIYIVDFGGNAALAKGGSGDVLAGLIASLLAQGMPAARAAAAGAWLHAEAARIAAKEAGSAGLSPADLPAYIGGVLRDLGR